LKEVFPGYGFFQVLNGNETAYAEKGKEEKSDQKTKGVLALS
jgi:hypothetical protein